MIPEPVTHQSRQKEKNPMNFLTLTFVLFMAVLLPGYYLVPRRWQNGILLGANYVFYLWQNPVCGLLLLLSTLISYGCARAMERARRRKPWLIACLTVLFGQLFLLKYLNFVCTEILGRFGWRLDGVFAGLILPVGISFFSFSLAGYVMDVYRGKIPAERGFVTFAVFGSFFPSILSGPITRAREMLPQLHTPRKPEEALCKQGLWRFLCGAAKKLVTVPLLASLADPILNAPCDHSSAALLLAAVCYSMQIYLDFSGYSDMAIGTALLLGISLPENFCAPYLSCSVKEFWKRWHISLTSWFREYLYFPLGGSRKGKWRTYCNVLIVFAVSGLWHGANRTFLVWGLLNGLYQVVGSMTEPTRARLRERLRLPRALADGWRMLITFGLITLSWVFFRAASVEEGWFILRRILLIFRDGPGQVPGLLNVRQSAVLILALAGCAVEDVRIAAGKRVRVERMGAAYWLLAAALLFALLLLGQYGAGYHAQDFLYFRF